QGRVAAALAALYGLLFSLILWKSVASVSVLLAVALLIAGAWLILTYLPPYTDHLSRMRVPGGRIAALRTALGLSLARQNGALCLCSATPRAWPEAKRFLTGDEIRARYAPQPPVGTDPAAAAAKATPAAAEATPAAAPAEAPPAPAPPKLE